MNWSETVFSYCERGRDPGFWAEPLNAATNAAFIVAAIVAAVMLMRVPAERRGVMPAILIALVFAIGIGSFLFHTLATRWASLADVVPIGLFMLAYLGYAMRRYLRLDWMSVAANLITFVLAMQQAGTIRCGSGACLNGTVGYAPALLALALIGGVLAWQRHACGRRLLAAGGVFALSMAMRTIDWDYCFAVPGSNYRPGTHFLWHILNAATLFLLLRAAILDRRERG